MSSIYIKCPKCGNSIYGFGQGHVTNTMNCELVKCSKCAGVFRDSSNKEWIRRNNLEKIATINPKAHVNAGVIALVVFAVVYGLIHRVLKIDDYIPLADDIGFYILLYVLTTFFIIKNSVNSMEFVHRYAYSIKRSKNQEYLLVLIKHGKIYGEDLPYGLRFSEFSKDKIERLLQNPYNSPEEFIPTFENNLHDRYS